MGSVSILKFNGGVGGIFANYSVVGTLSTSLGFDAAFGSGKYIEWDPFPPNNPPIAPGTTLLRSTIILQNVNGNLQQVANASCIVSNELSGAVTYDKTDLLFDPKLANKLTDFIGVSINRGPVLTE